MLETRKDMQAKLNRESQTFLYFSPHTPPRVERLAQVQSDNIPLPPNVLLLRMVYLVRVNAEASPQFLGDSWGIPLVSARQRHRANPEPKQIQ